MPDAQLEWTVFSRIFDKRRVTMATSKTEARSSFNDTFGDPKETTEKKVKARLTPYVQEFIKLSPFAVMASSDADGHCDASPKGGQPGFVLILDEHHLLFPDVAGNKLFQSYQNLEENPSVGLIFMIPGINETVRVNGKATIIDKDELNRLDIKVALHNLDERSYHLQGVLIEVEESYGHCPRAFKFSKLWDPEEISANQSRKMPDRKTDV